MGTACSSCFKGDETVIVQPDMVNDLRQQKISSCHQNH